MKGRPRVFKPDLEKVTLRIPESLRSRIQDYAKSHEINFNEAARRLFLGGLEVQYLMSQGFNWFQMLFENASKSPLFEDFRASFIDILSRFLNEFFEQNPGVLLRCIAAFLGGHLNYTESALGLDKGMLAKAVAGGNPEAERRMTELLENVLWIKEWIHK